MADCRVCGVPDEEKAMTFRKTDFCCEYHRQIIAGEREPNEKEWASMDAPLFQDLGGVARCD